MFFFKYSFKKTRFLPHAFFFYYFRFLILVCDFGHIKYRLGLKILSGEICFEV
jgi:hypothetical protein